MNNDHYNAIAQCLPEFGKDLLHDLNTFGRIRSFEQDEYVMQQGQQVRSLPILLNGAVKVYSEEGGIQFLLYYIHPGSTCVFSFAHLFNDTGINFSGIAQDRSDLLMVPIYKAREWLLKYPAFSTMVMNEYQKQYNDLLETTKQVICYNLEERLLNYLKTSATISRSTELSLTHQQIANDLATSREVISRLLKKLEKDQKITQTDRKIKLLIV